MYGGEGNLKTMVRRLYDIANALTCLNLTAKTHVDRKPAFIWKGSNGLDIVNVEKPVKVEKSDDQLETNDENLSPDVAVKAEPTNEEIVARVFN